MNKSAYWHFKTAAAFSFILALAAGVFLFVFGKDQSFLIINKYNHPAFDKFFYFFTYLGDGLIWIPLLAYALLYRRDFFVTIIVSLVICTLLTHFSKRVIFPDALRPIGILKDQIRKVPGVEVHHHNSFPSGHTSTAFTYALLMAYLLRRKLFTFLFPLIAFFVGYSRVYLAQHFVTDTVAGSIVGMASAYLALLFYLKMQKRKERLDQTTDRSATK